MGKIELGVIAVTAIAVLAMAAVMFLQLPEDKEGVSWDCSKADQEAMFAFKWECYAHTDNAFACDQKTRMLYCKKEKK